MKWNLQNRVVLPTILLITLTTVVVGLVSLKMCRSILLRTLDMQMTASCTGALGKTESWMDTQKANIACWAADPAALEAFTAKDSGGTAARDAFRADLVRLRKSYALEAVFVAQLDGTIMISSSPETEGKVNIGDRPYFKTVLAGTPAISDVIQSRGTSRPIVVLASPVLEGSTVRGVMVSVIDLGNLSQLIIAPIKIYDTGYAYMFDSKGQMLAHPDEKLIMKASMQEHDWGQQILTTRNGLLLYTFNDVEKRVAYRTSEALGWGIVVTVPMHELYAPLQQMTWTIGAVGAGILIVGALIALGTARALASPARYPPPAIPWLPGPANRPPRSRRPAPRWRRSRRCPS